MQAKRSRGQAELSPLYTLLLTNLLIYNTLKPSFSRLLCSHWPEGFVAQDVIAKIPYAWAVHVFGTLPKQVSYKLLLCYLLQMANFQTFT